MAEIIGERVGQLMRARGLTQQALAGLVGVTQPTIGRIINGETKETPKLHELARALHTTAEYLLGLTDDASPGAVADRRIPFRHAEPERDPDEVEIDHVDLRLGMGGGYLADHVELKKRKFSRAWLREVTSVAPEFLAWMKGDGDSMEPTIRSDEVVLVDRSKTAPGMDDKIWAIAVGEVGMIKRLRVLPSGTIEIHSDNPVVPVATAVDGELHVMGRVVAVVRRL